MHIPAWRCADPLSLGICGEMRKHSGMRMPVSVDSLRELGCPRGHFRRSKLFGVDRFWPLRSQAARGRGGGGGWDLGAGGEVWVGGAGDRWDAGAGMWGWQGPWRWQGPRRGWGRSGCEREEVAHLAPEGIANRGEG